MTMVFVTLAIISILNTYFCSKELYSQKNQIAIVFKRIFHFNRSIVITMLSYLLADITIFGSLIFIEHVFLGNATLTITLPALGLALLYKQFHIYRYRVIYTNQYYSIIRN